MFYFGGRAAFYHAGVPRAFTQDSSQIRGPRAKSENAHGRIALRHSDSQHICAHHGCGRRRCPGITSVRTRNGSRSRNTPDADDSLFFGNHSQDHWRCLLESTGSACGVYHHLVNPLDLPVGVGGNAPDRPAWRQKQGRRDTRRDSGIGIARSSAWCVDFS